MPGRGVPGSLRSDSRGGEATPSSVAPGFLRRGEELLTTSQAARRGHCPSPACFPFQQP